MAHKKTLISSTARVQEKKKTLRNNLRATEIIRFSTPISLLCRGQGLAQEEEAEIWGGDTWVNTLENLETSGHLELTGPAEVVHSFFSEGCAPPHPAKMMQRHLPCSTDPAGKALILIRQKTDQP